MCMLELQYLCGYNAQKMQYYWYQLLAAKLETKSNCNQPVNPNMQFLGCFPNDASNTCLSRTSSASALVRRQFSWFQKLEFEN